MRNVAFSGCQAGMTPAQEHSVVRILAELTWKDAVTFHEGDCVGSDVQFVELVRASVDAKVASHPTCIAGKRAYAPADVVFPVKLPLERNHEMVDLSDLLIATPQREIHDRCRHGTCATVRYAMAQGVSVFIVMPSGEIRRA